MSVTNPVSSNVKRPWSHRNSEHHRTRRASYDWRLCGRDDCLDRGRTPNWWRATSGVRWAAPTISRYTYVLLEPLRQRHGIVAVPLGSERERFHYQPESNRILKRQGELRTALNEKKGGKGVERRSDILFDLVKHPSTYGWDEIIPEGFQPDIWEWRRWRQRYPRTVDVGNTWITESTETWAHAYLHAVVALRGLGEHGETSVVPGEFARVNHDTTDSRMRNSRNDGRLWRKIDSPNGSAVTPDPLRSRVLERRVQILTGRQLMSKLTTTILCSKGQSQESLDNSRISIRHGQGVSTLMDRGHSFFTTQRGVYNFFVTHTPHPDLSLAQLRLWGLSLERLSLWA